MEPPERSEEARERDRRLVLGSGVGKRSTRYAILLGALILVLIAINTAVTKPRGASGLTPGTRLAPFAVPLATSDLEGDANVATRPHEGAAGKRPACTVREPRVLNICELYEGGPVVLALFVDAGSCPQVLARMQSLVASYPGVGFAAVAIKGERAPVRRLVRSDGLRFPVGLDADGALASIYKVASCPQVNFAYPGGIVQSRSLLGSAELGTLGRRVGELVAASRRRGWSPPSR